ncbi:MAG: hypothetical protein OXE95_08820 [Chloroflexi bacterium]|nr:hypothetical protein [Chloroflexota bacterium]MCY4247661.1 hypothetical protein [Chloroflexota bacterium]
MLQTRDLHPGLFLTLALTVFVALPTWPAVASLPGMMLASGGMYLFCHRRYGRLGALLAGLVYAYSPHLLVARGDWRDMLALALLPLLLWRIDALRDNPGAGSFISVCLLQAALLAAHASAIWLTLLAFAWVGFETTIQHINRRASQLRARPGLIALLAMLLGLALGAPFASAQTAVAMQEFVPLDMLLSTGAGLALLGAAIAFALYLRGYRTRHPNAFLGAAFFALAALGLLAWAQPPASAGIAVCLACTAGASGIGLTRLPARYQPSLIALLVALPIIISIPALALPASEDRPADSLEMPLSLDAALGLPTLALAGALIVARRRGAAQLPPRAYSTSLPLTRSAVIGALAGGALALLMWLITHSFYA